MRMDKYDYQLNDTGRCHVQLVHAKWISMINFKAGYHKIPFKDESSYDSTFTMHCRKNHWLRMPMGLKQAPVHFQFEMELVLKGKLGNRTLLVVVYLDDITVFGDK